MAAEEREASYELRKMREICLALPDTKETPTWGSPHFRIGDKIFAGYGEDPTRAEISFKLEKVHAAQIVADPRFKRAPYVGAHGWVSMDPRQVDDWDEVRALVHESYRLIAPKRSLAKLGGAAVAERGAGGAAGKGGAKRATVKEARAARPRPRKAGAPAPKRPAPRARRG